ncbi:helix-turn-helix domain-containing protein, partial [Prevotella brunnea]
MYKQLTSEQRYTISVLLQKKFSLSFIAEIIGVSVCTVSREINRNSIEKG